MMIRNVLLVAAVAGIAIGPALAQQPPAAPRPPMMMHDSMRPMMPQGPGPGMNQEQRMEMLRQRIEEQFGRAVQMELQLTEQQMTRLRAAMRANQDRRRDISRREQDLHRAVGQQLQPGVAANNDSLNRLLDAIGQARAQRAQSDQTFMRDLNFLTPVQRARFFVMVRRFEERMGEVRRRSQMGEPGPMNMRPGQRPMQGRMGPDRRPERMEM